MSLGYWKLKHRGVVDRQPTCWTGHACTRELGGAGAKSAGSISYPKAVGRPLYDDPLIWFDMLTMSGVDLELNQSKDPGDKLDYA